MARCRRRCRARIELIDGKLTRWEPEHIDATGANEPA